MLRDLLQDVKVVAEFTGLYAFLEALVQAVEPEDTDATRKRCQADGKIDQLHIVERRHIEARAAWAQLEASLREELTEAKAEIESLRPDAEIGRLVREMQLDSSLRHVASRYHAFIYVRASFEWGHVISVDSPAEALRSIQEVGDAEMS